MKGVFCPGGGGMFIIVPSLTACLVNALIFIECTCIYSCTFDTRGAAKEKRSLKLSTQDSLGPFFFLKVQMKQQEMWNHYLKMSLIYLPNNLK